MHCSRPPALLRPLSGHHDGLAHRRALASRVHAELGLKGRPQDSHRFHITLHHLGDFVRLPACERVAAEAAAGTLRCAPLALYFEHFSFDRENAKSRPLMRDASSGRMPSGNYGGSARCWPPGLAWPGSFMPQFALLYDDALVPQWPIEGSGRPADELALADSLIGQHGHAPLARWSLRT